MTKEILILDFTIQKGHVNINKAFIDALKKSFNVKLMTSNSYAADLGYKNDYVISEEFLKAKNRYYYVIHLAKAIRYVKRNVLNNNRFDAIIILGFENISFAFVWRFIKNKTFAIIHNNLTRKSLSSFCFKFISRKASFILLEDFLVEELKSKIKNKLYSIPHPINTEFLKLSINSKEILENQIFCPSASSDVNEVNLLKEKVQNHDKYKLILKGKDELISKNLVIKSFFDNYTELMLKSEFILIPFKFDLRVSGVFYEAMALNKKILATKKSGLYMKQMQKLYPNSIWIINSIDDLNNIKFDEGKNKEEHSLFMKNHSQYAINNCFNDIIYKKLV